MIPLNSIHNEGDPMKKNNRDQYLKTWLTYLKGKNQIDPKALADFLGDKLKGAFSSITLKRYTATVIINLYENGFLAGKIGKTFSGEPLEIVREITLPVLDKCLTPNYKKVKLTETAHPAEPVKPAIETPVKKLGRVAARRKIEKPEKEIAVKAKKTLGRKPGRKPRVKAAAKVLVLPERKPGSKKQKPIARKADLVKRGEEAFLFATRQQEQIEEMERVIANYERMFEAIRSLFSREMEEIEEWMEGLLK
jgi:hypothetical protein